ncbi:MAG: bifunctional DNA-formamidopyrimidine glycosylase/DNA-(apurinic or apyrimidinic site) lyase [Rhizobiales bacterium]|nr:bifunctional DNA-formamidopyrimidine glycosylase/DNA-(apurinic or apyrimidinic site) lyase [Hyphomicrobiales bacterium]
MPELPEVETVMRGLDMAMTGKTIRQVELRRKNLRFPFPENFAGDLEGQRVTGLKRRAKYIQIHLASGKVLVSHLGMSGRFLINQAGTAGFHDEIPRKVAHDHVVITLSDGTLITYNDPRRFGYMLLVPESDLEQHPRFRDIGVEPLGNHLNEPFLNDAFRGRATSLKAALMDQRIVAGLGNIYVCEALHMSSLSPERSAGSITTKSGAPGKRIAPLVTAIRDVLTRAIAAGGSSLKDFGHTDGSLGYFQHSFKVYDQAGEDCPRDRCKGTILRIVQNGRSTFYCPVCQK